MDLSPDRTRIAGFREKAPTRQGDVINGGVYIFEQTIFTHIPDQGPASLEYQVFPSVLKAGGCLWAYRHEGFFGDIGTPASLDRVKRGLRGET